jgi:uncharacterized peroxidase-related enzyme
MLTPLYDAATAPEGSQPLLEGVQKKMGGLLPNLYRQMAAAPAVLEAYLALTDIFGKTSFSPVEQQVILMTASAQNGCLYCVAAHSSAARMVKLDKDAIESIRNGAPISDFRLQALRSFVEAVLETRGKVGAVTLADFESAGYTREQAMEIVVGVAMKALSNSFSRMFDTPLDGFLERMVWDGNDRV